MKRTKSSLLLCSTWHNMKRRCLNPKDKRWKDYGGRGITICLRWLRFENFYSDMGPRPKGRSLDRVDNSKGYAPSNCRWATARQQQNNMRSNIVVSFNGKSKTLQNWCRLLGLKSNTVGHRIRRGSGASVALSLPIKPRNYGKIYFRGKKMTVTQWAKKLGIRQPMLSRRLFKYGWSIKKSLTSPSTTLSERLKQKGRM